MIIIGIIVSIIMFSIIVIIHEWGHFKAARIFGVHVEEFWLGIPPRAKKLFRDKKGTLFSLNWLFLWWFVRLKWETPHSFKLYNKENKILWAKALEEALEKKQAIYFSDKTQIWETIRQEIIKKIQQNSDKDNLNMKPEWQQAIIMLAGIFMNFVLAFFIFFILFLIGVKPIWINTKIETTRQVKLIPTYSQALEIWLLEKKPGLILSPIANSLAEKSGITQDDIIITLDWKNISDTQSFMNTVSLSKNKEIILWSKNKTFIITPSSEGKIWAYIRENIVHNNDFSYKYSVTQSFKYAWLETYNQTLLTFSWLKILFKKIVFPETKLQRQEAISQVSGPIGIVDFVSKSLSAWIIFLFIISAIISINLWVFNLLPIPALDGWRFVLITMNWLVKKIIGKEIISQNIQNIMHVIFFLFLIALSFLIAYNDINKIISN